MLERQIKQRPDTRIHRRDQIKRNQIVDGFAPADSIVIHPDPNQNAGNIQINNHLRCLSVGNQSGAEFNQGNIRSDGCVGGEGAKSDQGYKRQQKSFRFLLPSLQQFLLERNPLC